MRAIALTLFSLVAKRDTKSVYKARAELSTPRRRPAGAYAPTLANAIPASMASVAAHPSTNPALRDARLEIEIN